MRLESSTGISFRRTLCAFMASHRNTVIQIVAQMDEVGSRLCTNPMLQEPI